MTIEAERRPFVANPQSIELILGDITDFMNVPSPIRQGFVGYLVDYLMLVCREEFPSAAEVQMQIGRSIMYQKFGVIEELIGRGELVVLASQISDLQRGQKLRDPTDLGKLWTEVMVAVEDNVGGFGKLNPVRMNTAQNHLRVFLTAVDQTLGRNGMEVNGRLPDDYDMRRCQKSSGVLVEAGFIPEEIKHAELIGAAVLVRHYRERAGGEMNV